MRIHGDREGINSRMFHHLSKDRYCWPGFVVHKCIKEKPQNRFLGWFIDCIKERDNPVGVLGSVLADIKYSYCFP